MDNHDIIRQFHCDNWGAYDNIPTTTLNPKTKEPLTKDQINQIIQESTKPDSFTRTGPTTNVINPESADALKTRPEVKASKSFAQKAKALFTSLGNTIKKHKGITALVVAGVALVGGLIAKTAIDKKKANEAQSETERKLQ